MVTLAVSRSWGIRTTESMPARAAWAATELARLPVEAQAATLKPSWRALVSATETTRSLKEPVGLAVSSLIHSSPSPSSAARRSARPSGGKPAPRSTRGVAPEGGGAGRKALPADRGGDPLVVVGDLERPEAVVADVQGFGGEGALTFTTTQPSDKIDHRSSSSVGHWHQVLRTGCRDVDGPVPQSLWMMGQW